jgi:aldose 1-epimerase
MGMDQRRTLLPVERVAVPDRWRYATARPLGEVVLDHVFEPSTGAATIAWPDAGLAVTVEADSALDRRIVYVPADRDFLAFEPATHMTDAFNRAARGQPGTGTRRLPPGTSFSCTMRLNAIER